MNIEIGQLSPLDVKEIWEHEASDFTPWLAENIKLLGQTIGIELEIESTEKNVGPFRADILARDLLSDQWVLIENQLERTDHTHLGQIITYASGLEAATIIWIAKTFTEEHRSSIDWLNNITADRFNFFGIEIELWRIGDSLPAPRFNVIAKPNDWKKLVKKASDANVSGELSEIGKKRQDYWTDFKEYLDQSKSVFTMEKAFAGGYVEFPTDIQGVVVAAYVSFGSNSVGTFVRLLGQDAEEYFKRLLDQKESLENKVSCPIKWSETKPGHKYHISCELSGSDPSDLSNRGAQHQWLVDQLEKMSSFVNEELLD